EGSVFGGSGMIWIILIIVVVAGGAAGFGIYFRKRRKS
ncbi:MAG: LPXTG cell wall anchor domain-containing protein, partial [Eubacterium sp.]|nr:LPXTG cell wall anchor domain-containing protein [Eubacterium sp.]